MIDRWYYTHAGQTFGPVSAAQLQQLAAAGKLSPMDVIWPEGKNQAQGGPAQAAIDFSTIAAPTTPPPPAPPPTSPAAASLSWLKDMRAAEAKPSLAPAAAKLEWLDDVRKAEEKEREMLNIPWDGETASVEEEALAILEETSDPNETVEYVASPESTPDNRSLAVTARTCPLDIGSATTRGRVRDRNEDSLLVQHCTWSNVDRRHDVALVAIADGMGGHQAGERASGMVVRVLGGTLTPLLATALSGQKPSPASEDLAEALDRGMNEANRIVRQAAQDDAACKGMGSTAVALIVWDGRVIISLVGDCRVYHWRAGKLVQITRDQTLVARMVELGQLSPLEAAKHPRRNEVSQAVGKYALIEPARSDLSLEAGDWLVACCDGLYAHVNDRGIQDAIAKSGQSATILANRLIELANLGGGSDNCTVIAVRSL